MYVRVSVCVCGWEGGVDVGASVRAPVCICLHVCYTEQKVVVETNKVFYLFGNV